MPADNHYFFAEDLRGLRSLDWIRVLRPVETPLEVPRGNVESLVALSFGGLIVDLAAPAALPTVLALRAEVAT